MRAEAVEATYSVLMIARVASTGVYSPVGKMSMPFSKENGRIFHSEPEISSKRFVEDDRCKKDDLKTSKVGGPAYMIPC
jgi:hypothetical protein